jgi:3-oxoacyl-[acyl-carrier-protein] synthase II
MDPKVALALAAAEEAIADAGGPRLGERSLIHLGASLETYSLEAAGAKGASGGLEERLGRSSLRTPLDRASRLIEARHGRAGLSVTNCSACAAGLEALGGAFRAVASGRFELALAGAFDSMLNPLGLAGFHLLGALAAGPPEPPWSLCRPFDAGRRGLVMGEGAAVMVLEPLERAKAEGRRIHGEIIGYGSSLDAHGLSAPDPEGGGAFRAMRAALEEAGLHPQEVHHLSAHGTATRLNDPMEAAAVRRVFPNWPDLPVASVKSMTGHAIAAAGALEAAACLFAFSRGLVPPNTGLERVAPGCELDHVAGEARPFHGRVAMTNSFGFGGQNSAMLLRGPA